MSFVCSQGILQLVLATQHLSVCLSGKVRRGCFQCIDVPAAIQQKETQWHVLEQCCLTELQCHSSGPVVSPEAVLGHIDGLLVDIDIPPNTLKWQGFLHEVDE